ncbi:MAG: hypothetical protein HY904_03795 [Deltaproteobacteria bacterium]|nr:hypothetical protein [Deltaproteobacteria bacterium]
MRTLLGRAALMAITLAPLAALASGGEGGHAAPHVEFWKWDMHAPPVGWLIFDFALFLVLLVRFAGRPLRDTLVQRHNLVKKAIEEAAAAKAEAEKKAREFDERVQRLDGEIATLRAELKAGGEAARERLTEAGRRTAERIARDTQMTIAGEETRARQALQQEAARLALELAEKIVGQKLNADDHKKLRDEFVRELGN